MLKAEEYEIILTEMATTKKGAEIVIKGKGRQVFYHLLKILKYKDELNYQKHIKDIDTWLFSIQDIQMKGKNRRLKSEHYFNWLYGDLFEGFDVLTSTLNRTLKDYKELPIKRTDREVFRILVIIYKELSIRLSDNKFEGIDKILSEV